MYGVYAKRRPGGGGLCVVGVGGIQPGLASNTGWCMPRRLRADHTTNTPSLPATAA